MLWVGGGILVHGLEEIEILRPSSRTPSTTLAHARRRGQRATVGRSSAGSSPRSAAPVVGLVIGGIIVAIVRRFTKRPEELIVD